MDPLSRESGSTELSNGALDIEIRDVEIRTLLPITVWNSIRYLVGGN
jgi:hypothetical protein